MQTLLDSERIRLTIQELAQRILADKTLYTGRPLALIGIRERGDVLAQRLADELTRLHGGGVPAGGKPGMVPPPVSKAHQFDVGALDITLYRDDLSTRHAITVPLGTEMDFRVDDRPVILVDDVLDTGRSVRAALDALVDFGRPSFIRLAVLVDRARREYPIAADYIGHTINALDPKRKVIVHLTPTDSEDAVFVK